MKQRGYFGFNMIGFFIANLIVGAAIDAAKGETR